MSKLLIFTATYNEAQNIKKLIDLIFKYNPKTDMLVIDDNSPDLTFNLLKKLKKKYKNLLTIIIPRHTQRADDIIDEIKDLGLKVQVRSIGNKLNKNTEIYLVDTYGETKSFYKICKTVFLGGSLINHGGQNPLEPARLGCKILHGPYVQNFTEVYKLLEKNNLSSKFHNIDQLAMLADQSFKKNINYTNKIINLKKMGSNILNQTLTEINYYL